MLRYRSIFYVGFAFVLTLALVACSSPRDVIARITSVIGESVQAEVIESPTGTQSVILAAIGSPVLVVDEVEDLDAGDSSDAAHPPAGVAPSLDPANGKTEADILQNAAPPDVGKIDSPSSQETAPTSTYATYVSTGEVISFQATSGSLEVGDIVELSLDNYGNVSAVEILEVPEEEPEEPEIPQGNAAETIDGEETLNGVSYSSSSSDENALRVLGTADLQVMNLDKTGDSTSIENSNAYGLNAGLLITDGGRATIGASNLSTASEGAPAIFVYGQGSVASLSDTNVLTEGNSSLGVSAVDNAAITATNLAVHTTGPSSPAIKTSSGEVEATGGSFATDSALSPAVYANGSLNLENASLAANVSEALVVEGNSSVSLIDCTSVSAMSEEVPENQTQNRQGVKIYNEGQKPADGVATLIAKGGSLHAQNGDLFYITNADCEISLEGMELTADSGTAFHLGTDIYGVDGENGANASVELLSQNLSGNIILDDTSSMDLTLRAGSNFEGAINGANSEGEVNVTIEDGTWTLTGDSYIKSFNGEYGRINANGYRLFVDGSQAL